MCLSWTVSNLILYNIIMPMVDYSSVLTITTLLLYQGLKSMDLADTPEESLESLKKLALFIDRADLYDMSQIGKGVVINDYI